VINRRTRTESEYALRMSASGQQRRIGPTCNSCAHHPISADIVEPPLRANSCREHVQQTTSYSITASARCWRNIGTSRPSVLAVLRLIVSSNLTGAWIGSSLGFSPLRMRST